jgi:hypothetical protein
MPGRRTAGGRPDPLLVDLAAGRPIDPARVTAATVASAAEHGMGGHLRRALVERADLPDEPWRSDLVALGLAAGAQHRQWWEAATWAVARLEDAGFRVAALKGAAEESVAGLAPGTRTPTDVDLVLHPDHRDDLLEAARALDPGHELLRPFSIHPLMSTSLRSPIPSGMAVDLHVDALKMARSSRAPEQAWEAMVTVPQPARSPVPQRIASAAPGPSGAPATVSTFDPAASLVIRCAHHARDGYRSLEHHATIRALATRPDLDRDRLEAWADAEGIGSLVAATLLGVAEDLSVPRFGPEGWHRASPRRIWWSAARPARTRLVGPGWAPVPVRTRAEWALVRTGGAVDAARVVTRWVARPDPDGRGRWRSFRRRVLRVPRRARRSLTRRG